MCVYSMQTVIIPFEYCSHINWPKLPNYCMHAHAHASTRAHTHIYSLTITLLTFHVKHLIFHNLGQSSTSMGEPELQWAENTSDNS